MGLCVVVHIIVEWFVGPLGVAILTAIRVPPTELGTIIPHRLPGTTFAFCETKVANVASAKTACCALY